MRRLISLREIILVSSLIIIVTIIFFNYTQNTPHYIESFQLLDVFYVGSPLIAGILALFIAKKSKFRGILAISYLFFGIALFIDAIGESIFIYHEVVLGIDPYPSMADVFYGSFFFFAGFFMLKNIRYFCPKFLKYQIAIIAGSVIGISAIYSVISLDMLGGISSFDYWFGLIFVIGSSAILGLAIVGITVFEYSKIGIVWVILAGGITINTIGDVWYAHLEVLELYDATHLVNSFWFCSWLVISYALIKQYKVTK